MRIADQITPVPAVDRNSPNLLTMPMVDHVLDATSRLKWGERAEESLSRQSVERAVYDIERVKTMSEASSSPSMEHAYQHVASDMVRRLSESVVRAVGADKVTYASERDEAVLTDPVRVQYEAGLQRQDKGPSLAQPIFAMQTLERSSGIMNTMTNRVAGQMRDDEGREALAGVDKLDFATEERRRSPGVDKPREERTGEEQRTLAAYNAIATEGLVQASTSLVGVAGKGLLQPEELEIVDLTIAAAGRRVEKGSEFDGKAPEHVAERRVQVQAAMAAASMQR